MPAGDSPPEASPRTERQSRTSPPGSPPGAQAGRRAGSERSSSSSFGLVGGAFRRPETPPPTAATVRDLEQPEYVPPEPEPFEWDEDKTATVLKGIGGLLHAIDPVGESPYAPDLWRMTEDDLDEMAAPLSRIANRYETMRGLAGFSDEVGVGLGLAPYVKRNLALRGRVKARHTREAREGEHGSRYEPARPEPPAAPEAPPANEPEHLPAAEPPEPGPEREDHHADWLSAALPIDDTGEALMREPRADE